MPKLPYKSRESEKLVKLLSQTYEIYEKVNEHFADNGISWVIQHSAKNNHRRVSIDDVHILANNHGNTKSRKILKLLHIKRNRLTINLQEASASIIFFRSFRVLLEF